MKWLKGHDKNSGRDGIGMQFGATTQCNITIRKEKERVDGTAAKEIQFAFIYL